MKSATLKLAVISFAMLFAAVSCKSDGAGNSLVGHWEGDIESMKEMNPELTEDPMAEMMYAMLGAMKVEFTDDEMIIEAMGQKQSAGYKVVSSSGNKVTIEATEGDEAGEQTVVEFLDDDRVTLGDPEGEEPPMVLKRASE